MILKVMNLNKKFKNDMVLNNISYNFSSSHIYGIVGRNGSGKSVLLKIIAGLYIQDSGSVLFDSVDYNLKKEFPKKLGLVIESPTFLEDLSGFNNLKLLASIQNTIDDNDIYNILKVVNLYDDKGKKYGKYSLGMKQKLSIAQSLMEKPDVILLDEPFNGIDRKSVEEIKSYLNLLKQNGKLIIITTHIEEDINDLCDKKLYIEDGTFINEKD